MANVKELKIGELFSNSADNQLIVTDDDFFFVTDDSNIQHNAGSKFDAILQFPQVRYGYHNFLQVIGLSRKKENQKNFVFAICPFLFYKGKFSRMLDTLLEKTDYGKKTVHTNIIGRSSFLEALKNGHSNEEICTNPEKFAPNNHILMVTNFELLLLTYQEVKGMHNKIPQCIPSFCPECRSNMM